jgi:hypothetical protein
MKILIQYEGFTVSPISRTYNFHVIDAGESRRFTVQVPSELFRLTPLKFQDGPAICFERLQHEIESQELHAEAVLNVSASEIQDYLDRQHPPKAPKRERAPSPFSANSLPNPVPFEAVSNQTVRYEGSGRKEAGTAITNAAKRGWQGAQWDEIAHLKKRITEMDATGQYSRKPFATDDRR